MSLTLVLPQVALLLSVFVLQSSATEGRHYDVCIQCNCQINVFSDCTVYDSFRAIQGTVVK